MRDVITGRGPVIPGGEVRVRFSRSGGPGGQNVNKRDTKVEVLFDVRASTALTERQKWLVLSRLRSKIDSAGVLRVVAAEARTQAANREAALERLEALLHQGLKPPPKPRRATKPSRAAKDRRIADKKRRGAVKRLRRADDD
ncbi:MAG: alternative ribosome rescue aminoacyl-tRNA hydrolase ArfB [Actinomycetota bacterium]